MSDSARSKSKLLRDLENHLFPHTVPIKGRAQRLSVVQLDSGFGKGAEHLPRSTRSGYSQGAGRLPLRLQLGVRLSRPLPALRTEEFVYFESLFPLKQVIDRPAQFVSEDR